MCLFIDSTWKDKVPLLCGKIVTKLMKSSLYKRVWSKKRQKIEFSKIYPLYFSKYWVIGKMSRVFANGPGYRGSIPGRVIPKTQKMVLDDTLLNTQHYKVRIKCKVEQSKEWRKHLLLHLGVVAIEKGAFGSPSTKGCQLYFIFQSYHFV